MGAPGIFLTPSIPIPPTLVCNLGAPPHSSPLQMAKAPVFWSWGRGRGDRLFRSWTQVQWHTYPSPRDPEMAQRLVTWAWVVSK